MSVTLSIFQSYCNTGSGILCGSEHQVCEKSCGTAVSVGKRVDPYCLGMGHNTQFVRRRVVCVLPPVEDRVQRIAEVDSNLLVCNPDVDFVGPPFTCPRPNISVQAGVQVFEEVIGQRFIELQQASRAAVRSCSATCSRMPCSKS